MLDRKYSRVRVDQKIVLGKEASLMSTTAAGVETKILGAQSAAQADAAAATATAIAAAVPAAISAATATTIAAAIPAEPPNVDEDGVAAGGFITRAARRTLVQAVIDIRTYAVEQKADFDKVIADVDDVRTKTNDLRTHAVEMDLDYEALLVDVAALRTTVNALLAKLRTHGIIAT